MTFAEDITKLSSKTEVFKIALVNDNYEEKDAEEVLKNDKPQLYKYRFENQRNKILGKKPYTYDGRFFFNNLTILTNPENKIYAYDATVFYDGSIKDIDAFVVYMKNTNKDMKFTLNRMLGAMTVYQWKSKDKIIQIVKDNHEGTVEQFFDGKKSVVKSTYLKLTVYNSSFLNDAVEPKVERDIDFVIFNEKHFYNK